MSRPQVARISIRTIDQVVDVLERAIVPPSEEAARTGLLEEFRHLHTVARSRAASRSPRRAVLAFGCPPPEARE